MEDVIVNKEFEYEFKKLCESYSNSLPTKIQQIQDEFINLADKWNSKNYTELSSLIHKLNGSSGIYGYKNISEKAAQIEKLLSRFDRDIPASKDVLSEIEKLIFEIKDIINTSVTVNVPTVLQKIDSHLVFILNDSKTALADVTWVKKITDTLSNYGYETKAFSTIESLFEAIKQAIPVALIVDFDLIANPFVVNLSDTNVQEMIDLNFKRMHTIFVSKTGEFEKRLKAVRMGCKSFFTTPINVDEVISELENLKYLWSGKFRAITIDDEPEVLKYYSNLLTEADIENRPLSNYKNLENELHTFQPDIILLDLNMPECSGIELAAIIRQQKSYEDVPIVFLSTEENKSVQLKAMSVGVDDFITKASDPNYLIQTIRNKASRYKKIKSMSIKDNLTGAFNFRYMSREIEKYIELYNTIKKNFLICITQIDNITLIRNSYGYTAADQLLTSLYVLLSNQLDSSRIIGHATPDKFLIIFPFNSLEQAKQEMLAIQKKFNSSLQYSHGKAYSSSFSVGFAIYQNGCSIESLLNLAEMDIAIYSKRKNTASQV